MKTRYKNDLTDCTDMVHAENEIKLSWPIRPGVYDEN